jgi:hypothetical protein
MKRTVLSIFILSLCTLVFTQVPESFNYQAIPRNASGGTYPDQAMNLRISILSGSPTGSSVYTETFSQTSTSLGLLNLQIGKGTVVSGSFSTINWGAGSYYLKVEIDPNGGTNYVAMGTTQLLSVPYALHSKTTQTADYNNLTNLPTLNISNWNTAYSWGNHAGLYRPVGYVPSWTDVTDKPGFATVATSGSYNDLTNKPTLLNSQWNTSGSNIYYNSGNIGIGTNTPATFIHAHGAPVVSRGQFSLSSPTGQDIFLSFYEANSFKAYLWYNISDQDLRLQNFTAGDLNLNPYGGKVGIGTNNPGYVLDVLGDINFTGAFYRNGIPFAGDYNSLNNKPDLTVYATKNMQNQSISNLANPVNAQDAATKAYVDNSEKHSIGESYGGGIVFYVYDNGQHGLIAATSDQSSGIRWHAGTYTNTMAKADGVGAGKANTAIIIANQGYGDGATYAARICSEYQVTVGGIVYGDWYLPSRFELNLLYLQKNLVGGFANDYYWRSTEVDNIYAWYQNFTDGYQNGYANKNSTYHVRAIRAF